MKHFSLTFIVLSLLLGSPLPGSAHFGMLIPDHPVINPENRSTTLNLSFSHPFEEVGMELVKPEKFYVIKDGQKTDLLNNIEEGKIMGQRAWHASFKAKRPGVYHFVMEPVPYWEPSEDLSIIHYTKVIVPAFGAEDSWDEPVGLPTEIVPLLRPFGNYVGNSFSGRVLVNGKVAPGAEVEVEFYNQGQAVKAASDHHITQVIKADDNGVFTFSCPFPGWWGFAALSEGDFSLNNPQGQEKPVELGAVLWIYMHPLQQRENTP
ncbi:MAG: DUF4198 domain-containing protein [Thermodesulfobacteriota bacterium]